MDSSARSKEAVRDSRSSTARPRWHPERVPSRAAAQLRQSRLVGVWPFSGAFQRCCRKLCTAMWSCAKMGFCCQCQHVPKLPLPQPSPNLFLSLTFSLLCLFVAFSWGQPTSSLLILCSFFYLQCLCKDVLCIVKGDVCLMCKKKMRTFNSSWKPCQRQILNCHSTVTKVLVNTCKWWFLIMLIPFSVFSKSESILYKLKKKAKQNTKNPHKQANQHKPTKNNAHFRASPSQ